MGTCSACATSRPSASQRAVEKSRLELRICEYEVRSIASPISCTIASSRCWMTETVIGSTRSPTDSASFGGSLCGPGSRAHHLTRPARAGPGAASTQNFGYQSPGSSSEVTVTNPPREGSVTRASLREYAVVQRERYRQATRAEKRRLLDEVVAVTGIH